MNLFVSILQAIQFKNNKLFKMSVKLDHFQAPNASLGIMFEAVPTVSSGNLFFSMFLEIFISVNINDPNKTNTTTERQITATKRPTTSLFVSSVGLSDVSAMLFWLFYSTLSAFTVS